MTENSSIFHIAGKGVNARNPQNSDFSVTMDSYGEKIKESNGKTSEGHNNTAEQEMIDGCAVLRPGKEGLLHVITVIQRCIVVFIVRGMNRKMFHFRLPE